MPTGSLNTNNHMHQQIIEHEKIYLISLMNIFRQQQYKDIVALTKKDYEKICRIYTTIINKNNNYDNAKLIETIVDLYKDGLSVKTPIPAWMLASPALGAIENENLNPHKKNWFYYLKKEMSIEDKLKRIPDTGEDILNAMRTLDAVKSIPETTFNRLIGGLNLLSGFFELRKGAIDFYEHYKGEDKFRSKHLVDSGLRMGFASSAIIFASLFIGGVLSLPVALTALSLSMLALYSSSAIKNTYIYYHKRKAHKESKKTFENKIIGLEKECQAIMYDIQNPELFKLNSHLQNKLYDQAYLLGINSKEFKEYENRVLSPQMYHQQNIAELIPLLHEKRYQIAAMQHRLKHDKDEYLEAQRQLSFSMIEVLTYAAITAAAIIALVILLNPLTAPIAATIATGLTLAGVIAATGVKLFEFIDERYNHKLSTGLRNFGIAVKTFFRNYPESAQTLMDNVQQYCLNIFNKYCNPSAKACTEPQLKIANIQKRLSTPPDYTDASASASASPVASNVDLSAALPEDHKISTHHATLYYHDHTTYEPALQFELENDDVSEKAIISVSY